MKMKYLKEQMWMLRRIEEEEQRDRNEGETHVSKQISDFQYETLREIQELQKEIQELTEAVAEGDPQ